MKNARTIVVLLLLGVLTVTVAALRCCWIETCFPRVVRLTVPVAKLPPEQEGATLAMLSDFHFHPSIISAGAMRRVKKLVQRENPDLVLLLGDYRDRMLLYFPDRVASQLLAPLRGRFGVFGVRGNHDEDLENRRHGDTRRMLANAGILLLAGDRVTLPLRGRPFQLCGAGGGADAWYELTCAMAGADRNLPVIAIAHDPGTLEGLAVEPPDLLLCGHTHHGQIRLPFLRDVAEWVDLLCGLYYDYGYHTPQGKGLVITAGLGVTKLPFRWRDPAEIMLVTLRRAEAEPR